MILTPDELKEIIKIIKNPVYDTQCAWIEETPVTQDDFIIPIEPENTPYKANITIHIGTNYCTNTKAHKYADTYEPASLFETEIRKNHPKLYNKYIISLIPHWDWTLANIDMPGCVYTNPNRQIHDTPTQLEQDMIEFFKTIDASMEKKVHDEPYVLNSVN